MRVTQTAAEKAVTTRGVLLAAAMVLLWTLGACLMAVNTYVYTQQLLMVLGFGAILTVFLLQFPRVFLGVLAATWLITFGYMYRHVTPDEYGLVTHGLLRSLPVMLGLGALAVYLRRRPLRRGELVVIYACVLIAVPWCVSIKACIESSVANLFEVYRESEKQVYAWSRDLPWWGPTAPPPSPPVAPVPPTPAAPIPAPTPPEPSADAATQAEHAAAVARFERALAASQAEYTAALARYTQALAAYQPAMERYEVQAAAADRASLDAARGFAQGNGGEVPWALWWRPLLYWTLMCLAYEAMLMGLLLMFRKRWIEHERLPMVWSQPALMVLGPQPPRQEAVRRWISFGIGLAICVPAIFLMSPGGEAASNWTIVPWAGQEGWRGGFDLTSMNLLPGVNLKLFWGPLVLAMLLLFPVDVLMTVALTYILLKVLLPGIMNSFGMTDAPRYLAGYAGAGLRLGGYIGLFVWSLVFNARTIWGYVRSLWGARPTDAESDDELGRRGVLLLTLAGAAGFLFLASYATTLVQAGILTAMVLVYALAQVRQRIEGYLAGIENNYGSHQLVSLQHDVLHDHYTLAMQDASMQVTGSSWATHWMQWGFNGQLKSFGPHNMLLDAFKVAHELKVHARTIAAAIALTMIAVAVITPLLYVQLMYSYGFENSFQGGLSTWQSFTQWSERGISYGMYSTSRFFYSPAATWYDRYATIFNVGYGIATIGLLMYLRREYPRFPLSPVGVVIASEGWLLGQGLPLGTDQIWFSFLAAWAVKALLFRWVGVRTFREKVQPVVIMLLCGMILGMMLFIFRHVAIGQGALK